MSIPKRTEGCPGGRPSRTSEWAVPVGSVLMVAVIVVGWLAVIVSAVFESRGCY